jgi:hypothetical protein
MLYVLIRTCVRDDYISVLAYYSLKKIYPDAKYIFLAEQPTNANTGYKFITQTDIKISFRPFCDNFGGQTGAKNLINSMKNLCLNVEETDYVFIVDSDIVVFGDFLSEIQNQDHCGVMDSRYSEKIKHISGQFQITSGTLYKILINLTAEDIDRYVHEMIYKNISCADDTFISFISDKFNLRKKYVCNWVHRKFYEYTGNLDFENVIEEIKLHRPSNAL